MGGEGAMLYYNGSRYLHKGYKVKVRDTVGSGDAFLAGLMAKLLDHASPVEALEFASGLGAFVATCTGPCPQYEVREIYHLLKAGVVQ
jgi:fructokinase